MPYRRKVWSWYTGFGTQKIEQYPTEQFLFYQIDKLISFVLNLLKEGRLRRFLLNQVWYGRKKTKRFHKRTCNSYLKTLMRHSYFHSDMRQVTIQNNLDPAIHGSKLLTSNWNNYLGKIDCYQTFFVYLFPWEILFFIGLLITLFQIFLYRISLASLLHEKFSSLIFYPLIRFQYQILFIFEAIKFLIST